MAVARGICQTCKGTGPICCAKHDENDTDVYSYCRACCPWREERYHGNQRPVGVSPLEERVARLEAQVEQLLKGQSI